MSLEEKCCQMTQISFELFQKKFSSRLDPFENADDDRIDITKLMEAISVYKMVQ